MNINKPNLKTNHKFIVGDSRKRNVKADSVDLVVTSPPYPMIQMWDKIFKLMNPKIDIENEPQKAFDLMNKELTKVYKQMYKALKIGGIMVINIGDATRTINKNFKLYTNGARTIEICEKIGFNTLPQIHWRKPVNSPNKFMGSGMLPIGAYVTLENEHILIFRKGRRFFKSDQEKLLRHKSAFFQNERNTWFSDIWFDVVGAQQKSKNLNRKRSGAYPEEIPFRIINMFSVQGDVVLDPFGGTGTTSIAAMRSGRSSIVIDIDKSFLNFGFNKLEQISIKKLNDKNDQRVKRAIDVARNKLNKKGKESNYQSTYGPVYTRQERSIWIPQIKEITKVKKNMIVAEYYPETKLPLINAKQFKSRKAIKKNDKMLTDFENNKMKCINYLSDLASNTKL